jgi:hypothetical protein
MHAKLEQYCPSDGGVGSAPAVIRQGNRANIPWYVYCCFMGERNSSRTTTGHIRMNQTSGSERESFPVSVILERREIERGPLTVPQWGIVGVVAGDEVAASGPRCTIVHSDSERTEYLWPGFQVVLYKDCADSYWYNLTAAAPSLFVICHEDDECELAPVLVSANYDEAGAYMEADDLVLSAPMPPEVYQWIERYVVENYVPQAPRKRKRERWAMKEKGAP